jgi:hypothetical protein
MNWPVKSIIASRFLQVRCHFTPNDVDARTGIEAVWQGLTSEAAPLTLRVNGRDGYSSVCQWRVARSFAILWRFGRRIIRVGRGRAVLVYCDIPAWGGQISTRRSGL